MASLPLFFFVIEVIMKGYYTPTNKFIKTTNAKLYECNHPLYKRCTLYLQGDLGLAVVQQRFSDNEKVFWWGPIDPWLIDDIFRNEKFQDVFRNLSGQCANEDGIYPTVEVRKLMYALNMKPMKKAYWEKGFSS